MAKITATVDNQIKVGLYPTINITKDTGGTDTGSGVDGKTYIPNPDTGTFFLDGVDTGTKAIGEDGKSLTFEDLTDVQKEELRGKDFTFGDLTEPQKEELRGETLYEKVVATGYTGTEDDFYTAFVGLLSGNGDVVVTPPSTNPLAGRPVFVVGASNTQSAIGRSLNNTSQPLMTALANIGITDIDAYGYGIGGEYIGDVFLRIDEIQALYPNAIIYVHSGGNNVSRNVDYNLFRLAGEQSDDPDNRDYPSFTSDLDRLFSYDEGKGITIIPMPLTNRLYNINQANVTDDSDWDYLRDLGTYFYNKNEFLPRISQKFPELIRPSGRAIFDLWTPFWNEFEKISPNDGVHLTDEGDILFAETIAAGIAHMIKGIPSTEVIEETRGLDWSPEYGIYVEPDVVSDSPLTLMSFGAIQGAATNKFNQGFLDGTDHELGDEEGNVSEITISGTVTGGTASITAAGVNSATSQSGYNGTLNCLDVLLGCIFLSGGKTADLVLKTQNPLTDYVLGACVSRVGTTVKETQFIINGVPPVVINASTTPASEPVYRTVTSDENGEIKINISGLNGQTAYFNGLSIRKA